MSGDFHYSHRHRRWIGFLRGWSLQWTGEGRNDVKSFLELH